MAWISMSERDLKRIELLSEVRCGRRTVVAAAAVLAIREPQAYRLLAKYERDGGRGLIHKARGQTASNRLNDGIRDYTMELVRQNYHDFGPTLAAEVMLEQYMHRAVAAERGKPPHNLSEELVFTEVERHYPPAVFRSSHQIETYSRAFMTGKSTDPTAVRPASITCQSLELPASVRSAFSGAASPFQLAIKCSL